MAEEAFMDILNSFVTQSGIVDCLRYVLRCIKFGCHFFISIPAIKY